MREKYLDRSLVRCPPNSLKLKNPILSIKLSIFIGTTFWKSKKFGHNKFIMLHVEMEENQSATVYLQFKFGIKIKL